ncbi:response regulator [Spirochaetota bacterium]
MIKILLIDDEESIVNVLSLSLRSDGYDVVTAYNGEESLGVFEKESPDIVITDLKMPGMNGFEVLKKMKELNQQVEVIVITGHGDMDSAIEALQIGASDFINKPVRGDALTIALDRAKDKILIRQQLEDYTQDLENMVQMATDELRRKSELQSKLISSSNDGVIATDETGNIVIYNPGASKIFGYSRSEVIRSKNITDLLPQLIADEICKGLDEKKINKDHPWKEVNITSTDGEDVPTRFSWTLLMEKEQLIGSVVFLHDLRQIKRLERELVKSERLAAVGQTVAGLAHYIKNILTGLKGGSYVANIGFSKKDFKQLSKGWEMIQKNITMISDLVLELLTYSKDRKPDYKNISPNEIAEDVCELMDGKAKESNIKIIRDFSTKIKFVALDRQFIHRSLLNLVSNAIDACVFDENDKKKYEVRVSTKVKKEEVIFEIADNGSGMSDEVKSNLFSSLFSTKMGKGTGFGLLVTKKLIEEHNGKLEYISELEKGTTFIITIPFMVVDDKKKNVETKK